MTTDSTPRVWIGCLACYNAGDLIGEWFDAVDAPTDMDAWHSHPNVKAGTWVPKFRIPWQHYDEQHEELCVMDTDNFGEFLTGECSPSEAKAIAEKIDALPDYIDRDAVAAYCHITSTNFAHDFDLDEFEEAYAGQYDSDEDFAQETAADLGFDTDGLGWPAWCIDWEYAARELMYDYSEHRGYYFRNL